jgi:hypothetical protein
MARALLTGVIELSSGVWSLAGSGALAGRMSMAAFMLGWAGVSVHCQVLSFLGDSGLSPRTYLVGKFLHGGFSALLTTVLCRLIPFGVPVSSFIAEQVEGIAGMDFERASILPHSCLDYGVFYSCWPPPRQSETGVEKSSEVLYNALASLR